MHSEPSTTRRSRYAPNLLSPTGFLGLEISIVLFCQKLYYLSRRELSHNQLVLTLFCVILNTILYQNAGSQHEKTLLCAALISGMMHYAKAAEVQVSSSSILDGFRVEYHAHEALLCERGLSYAYKDQSQL